MHPTNLFFMIATLFSMPGPMGTVDVQEKDLFVCYGRVDPDMVQDYGLVVLESAHYTKEEISRLCAANNKVVGYISLTEINKNAALYEQLKPYAKEKEGYWESFLINITNPRAKEILLNEVARIMAMGYDGVFLDNLDNANQWGELRGLEDHLIQIIETIRNDHQGIYLVQNSGLAFKDKLNQVTNAILLESLVTHYDFDKNEYRLRDQASKSQMLAQIKSVQNDDIQKDIYILEYADDSNMQDQIVKELKGLHLKFYIAAIDLQAPSNLVKP